ncbi:response regulator transcription factor [Tessaracoccus sp. MC1679]|uniref:response regulator n=1 Tax=unclassified Tessaracoccus TaxID=2635419 RepID=UPI0016005DDD|nr:MULTISPECIES: response regulator transcription factor [unclassified Tessaracoccus]MBB1511420.1 response regulator transcription factor [Tessaracoccus sp. MC1627]MBB1514877.1 response regulator transcription factor [Tessaracoccus sp. MC1679]
MIRVVIADDEALVRSGLALLLRHEPGFEVAGLAGDGLEAVSLVREQCPDVVLMDIRMPGIDGLEATRRIVGDPSTDGCRVLVLTTFDHDENVFAALRAGASGFLPKDTEPERLLEALRVVASGEALLAPHATRRLIEEFRRGAPPMVPVGPALDALTDREAEVLAAVAAGLSNAEIAQRLVISYATAKTHVSRLLTKLDARDRAQLVIIAYEHGLVQPGG